MVRIGTNPHGTEPEDDEGHEFSATAGTGGSDGSFQRDGRSSEQKGNSSRSKHSETEQRRRFQILKDLIPPNDQKRDKASLLLEVIEYIKFLQENLRVYEASHPSWTQEPAKLIPWRSSAQMDSFIDHPDIMKSGSGHENVFQPMSNEQKSAESNFSGDAAHRGKDLLSGSDTSAVPLGVPYQPIIHRSGTGVLPSDTIACQPLLQTCWSKPSTSECPIAGSSSNGTKKNDISSVYSHGLMKNLAQAFRSSGVDLSQTSISVELDISKRANANATASTSAVAVQVIQKSSRSIVNCETGSGNYGSKSAKRLRTEAI
ncbi:Transcription factor BIM2-like protein [Drosera capensis]